MSREVKVDADFLLVLIAEVKEVDSTLLHKGNDWPLVHKQLRAIETGLIEVLFNRVILKR